MRRAIVLIVGWTVAFLSLYLGLVALELYWNLFDWLPRLDLRSLGLVIILLAALAATWWLARLSMDCGSRIFSLVGCLALIALGVYVLPPEPQPHGLFSGRSHSPLWYRGGRLVVFSCPGFFWVFARRCYPTAGMESVAPTDAF